MLDYSFDEPSEQDMGILQVNWFKKKEPFDFDEIWIKEADDFDVEQLVMKLRNDMDDHRRKQLPSVSVYLSLNLRLSPAKMNLLKDNFKIVIKNSMEKSLKKLKIDHG